MASNRSPTSQHRPAQRRGRLWARELEALEEKHRDDWEFWRQMTPNERVEFVEQLRQAWWEQHGEGEMRVQKVARVIRRDGTSAQ